MNDIRMDVNLINDAINKINTSKTKIDSAITQISLLTGNIEKNWEGSSQDYVMNLLNCSNDMCIMIDNIDSLIELLSKIAIMIENNFQNIQSKSIDLYQ